MAERPDSENAVAEGYQDADVGWEADHECEVVPFGKPSNQTNLLSAEGADLHRGVETGGAEGMYSAYIKTRRKLRPVPAADLPESVAKLRRRFRNQQQQQEAGQRRAPAASQVSPLPSTPRRASSKPSSPSFRMQVGGMGRPKVARKDQKQKNAFSLKAISSPEALLSDEESPSVAGALRIHRGVDALRKRGSVATLRHDSSRSRYGSRYNRQGGVQGGSADDVSDHGDAALCRDEEEEGKEEEKEEQVEEEDEDRYGVDVSEQGCSSPLADRDEEKSDTAKLRGVQACAQLKRGTVQHQRRSEESRNAHTATIKRKKMSHRDCDRSGNYTVVENNNDADVCCQEDDMSDSSSPVESPRRGYSALKDRVMTSCTQLFRIYDLICSYTGRGYLSAFAVMGVAILTWLVISTAADLALHMICWLIEVGVRLLSYLQEAGQRLVWSASEEVILPSIHLLGLACRKATAIWSSTWILKAKDTFVGAAWTDQEQPSKVLGRIINDSMTSVTAIATTALAAKGLCVTATNSSSPVSPTSFSSAVPSSTSAAIIPVSSSVTQTMASWNHGDEEREEAEAKEDMLQKCKTVFVGIIVDVSNYRAHRQATRGSNSSWWNLSSRSAWKVESKRNEQYIVLKAAQRYPECFTLEMQVYVKGEHCSKKQCKGKGPDNTSYLKIHYQLLEVGFDSGRSPAAALDGQDNY